MTKVLPSATAPDLLIQEVRALDDGYRLVFERNPTPMWVVDLARKVRSVLDAGKR